MISVLSSHSFFSISFMWYILPNDRHGRGGQERERIDYRRCTRHLRHDPSFLHRPCESQPMEKINNGNPQDAISRDLVTNFDNLTLTCSTGTSYKPRRSLQNFSVPILHSFPHTHDRICRLLIPWICPILADLYVPEWRGHQAGPGAVNRLCCSTRGCGPTWLGTFQFELKDCPAPASCSYDLN